MSKYAHDHGFTLKPRRKQSTVIIAAVGVAALLFTGGYFAGAKNAPDPTMAAGQSRWQGAYKVAYEAGSGSEKAYLDYVNKKIAPKYGISIEPVGIQDGNQLDQATADGLYAANVYQHKHWLKQVTDKTGWHLEALGPVFQWSYSAWSSKYKTLEDIPKGGTIALLNDPANLAQALWLLERDGKITFNKGVNPWSAGVKDIATNPNNWQFKLVDYGAAPRALDDVDAAIAYNFQFITAGIDQKFKIFAPEAPLDFAGQLVVGSDFKNDPAIAKLKQVFFDPEIQKYLATTTDPGLKDQISPISSK